MFKLHLMFSAPIFWRIPPQQGWAILSLEYRISYSRIIWHLSYIVISRQYRDIYTISKFVQISDFFSVRWQTFVRHLSHLPKVSIWSKKGQKRIEPSAEGSGHASQTNRLCHIFAKSGVLEIMCLFLLLLQWDKYAPLSQTGRDRIFFILFRFYSRFVKQKLADQAPDLKCSKHDSVLNIICKHW